MPPFRLRAGTMVGRYELVRALGGGAGGAVYEALDSALGRRVALKVLHVLAPGMACATRTARFLREGRIASRVRHPNVVDVFDFGVHDGVPFFVMELVEGESLAELLARERALPLARAVDMLLPVLSAVAALHASGVVHRDIKPANILLPRGSSGAKLADFGVSRLADESMALTRSGAVIGTIEYLAPELIRLGTRGAEASDQYALGVLLYECTTGDRPFRGHTAYQLMHAAANGDLKAPSALVPSLPRAFDVLVLRSMHREPERRFASVDKLAEGLLSFASKSVAAHWRGEFAIPAMAETRDSEPSRRQETSASAALQPANCDEDPDRRATRSAFVSSRGSVHPPNDSPLPPPFDLCERPPSVLVVDDDELNLRTFQRAFRRDFEITCADSGAKALELLVGASFDVALVDFAMPEMNGVEFLRAARTLRTDLPAVMVTAHADLPEVRAAFAAGWVHAIIMKPFEREAILRWVFQCHRVASMRKTVGAMRGHLENGWRA